MICCFINHVLMKVCPISLGLTRVSVMDICLSLGVHESIVTLSGSPSGTTVNGVVIGLRIWLRLLLEHCKKFVTGSMGLWRLTKGREQKRASASSAANLVTWHDLVLIKKENRIFRKEVYCRL
jgi:hypothetical protein